MIRDDLVVAVIYLSQGYSIGGPWSESYSKTKKSLYIVTVAHMKNIT